MSLSLQVSISEAITAQCSAPPTITKIVNGHPNARLDELLPWAYPTATAFRAVA
jgi:transposase